MLHALTALGWLTAAGAGVFLLSLRAGRVEPTLQVEFAAGPPPGVVVLEAANDPGPLTGSVAVASRLDPALLPLPRAIPPLSPCPIPAARRPTSPRQGRLGSNWCSGAIGASA